MRAAYDMTMTAMSIEECQRLNTPLRRDLEILDDEIRSLLARIRREANDAGGDDAAFVKASTTILLSIAAGVLAHAAEDHRAAFDANSFAACAGAAAKWAGQRRRRRARDFNA